MKDDIKAVEWYRKAAEQGHEVAQNNLGWMYQQGRGVPQDDQAAINWYSKAANQGYSLAQDNLGWVYEHGWGVKKDLRKAREWYQKSAKQSYKPAKDVLQNLKTTSLRSAINQPAIKKFPNKLWSQLRKTVPGGLFDGRR